MLLPWPNVFAERRGSRERGLARPILVVAAFLLVATAVLALQVRSRDRSRRAEIARALDEAASAESGGLYSAAVQRYESLLEREDLSPDERADVRFRLARARIEGNDLRGALGVLHDLTVDDVARLRIDLGPLYLRLAEKARARGDRTLALLANREGTAVSPARVEQFMEQRETIAEELRGAGAPKDGGSGERKR